MIVLGLFGVVEVPRMYTRADLPKVDDTAPAWRPHVLSRNGTQRTRSASIRCQSLGVVFALFCIGGSFGGGNMFPPITWGITKTTLESRFGMVFDGNESMYFRIMMAILVGLVIIGGIKRIPGPLQKNHSNYV